MFIMTNTTAVEKFTAATEETLQPLEAMLREWSDQMAPKGAAEAVQPEK